jgi:carboxymethylenebutenolidase
MNDVAALFGFIDRQSEVKQGQVGCHGYCMSGPYALAAAARAIPSALPPPLRFTVPGSSATPRRARISHWAGSRGTLHCLCRARRAGALPMVDELRTLFQQAGSRGEIEYYPGVRHGFAFPQRWCYDKPAGERLIALYRLRLGQNRAAPGQLSFNGAPSSSSARSTSISTACPCFCGSRSFSGWTRRRHTSS